MQRATRDGDFYLLFMGKLRGGDLKLGLSSIRVVRELHRKQFCNSFFFQFEMDEINKNFKEYSIRSIGMRVGVYKYIYIYSDVTQQGPKSRQEKALLSHVWRRNRSSHTA